MAHLSSSILIFLLVLLNDIHAFILKEQVCHAINFPEHTRTISTMFCTVSISIFRWETTEKYRYIYGKLDRSILYSY